MSSTIRFPIVGLWWLLAAPHLAVAADPPTAGTRCELTKPLEISLKPAGRGRKVRLERGTELSIAEVDGNFARVETDADSGYVKLRPLTKRCVAVAVPQEPAAALPPAAPMPSTPADDGSGIAVEPLQFGGAADAAAPVAPPGTHQCDYQSVEDCAAECKRGHAGSCYSAGEQQRFILSQRAPEPANYRRIAALYTRACNRHHAEGCLRLGEIYARGEGVKMDDRVVAALYEKACTLGSALGCTNIGYSYWAGEGVAVDQKKAAAMYSSGCDLGSAQGCTSLGTILQAGTGLPKDAAGAFALFRKACYSGPALGAEGCANLGYCYEAGLGITADRNKAVEAYRRACTGKAAYGCERLQALGEPLPELPATATPSAAAVAADADAATAPPPKPLATPAAPATPTVAPVAPAPSPSP